MFPFPPYFFPFLDPFRPGCGWEPFSPMPYPPVHGHGVPPFRPGYPGHAPSGPGWSGFGGAFSPDTFPDPRWEPASRMQHVAMAAALRAQIDGLRAYREVVEMQLRQVDAAIHSCDELLRRWEDHARAEAGDPVPPRASDPRDPEQG
jgi:hypothetical protein